MANTVVGVFRNDSDAQDAVSELLVSGFYQSLIRVFSGRESQIDEATVNQTREKWEEQDIGSFFRALAEISEEGEDLAAYADLAREGLTVLAVYAESDERVDRAIEVISHHSPLNIEEYYTLRQSPPLIGATDVAVAPSDTGQRRSGHDRESSALTHVRVFRHEPAGYGKESNSAEGYDLPPFTGNKNTGSRGWDAQAGSNPNT